VRATHSSKITTLMILYLAAGLTQVLSDGMDTYLYRNGLVAQSDTSGAQYFLGDALGSVRQLVDVDGELLLAHSYEPYGEVLESVGDGESSYSFAAEMADPGGLLCSTCGRAIIAVWLFSLESVWHGDYRLR
jgi:hypothetical protein